MTGAIAATRSAVPSYPSLSAMSAKPFALVAVILPSIANAAWSAKDRSSALAMIKRFVAKLSAAALGGLERASAATSPHPMQSRPQKGP